MRKQDFELRPFYTHGDTRLYFTSPETCLRGVNDSLFGARDFVFVINDWYVPDHPPGVTAYTGLAMTGFQNLRILCNSREEQDVLFDGFGFPRDVTIFCPRHFPHGLSTSTHVLSLDEDRPPEWRAVLNARSRPYKNRWAAQKVSGLALLDCLAGEPDIPCAWRNTRCLPLADVASVLQRSRVGLVLSFIEGACLASLEFLLCGLPVVSTHSLGGRDVWYTNENCILVGPSIKEKNLEDFDRAALCDEVAAAVDLWIQALATGEVDRRKIRADALAINRGFAEKFCREVVSLTRGREDANIVGNLMDELVLALEPYYRYGAYAGHA